jgi:dihydroorotate dehydrogenase (fumarate)
MLFGKKITPIMNASGPLSSTMKDLDVLNNSFLDCFISKSTTLLPRQGNPENVWYNDRGSINTIGLSNFGYQYYSSFSTDKLFIQSIHPFTVDEFDIMLPNVQHQVELNISCPNATRENHLKEYLQVVKKHNRRIGIKLPVMFEGLDATSSLLLSFQDNIEYICCSNTIPGLFVVNGEKVTGGVGGSYIKPFSLSNVWKFSQLLGDKIKIIGCGGIETGKDMADYISCGATAVQVGSCFLKEGISCFDRIWREYQEM